MTVYVVYADWKSLDAIDEATIQRIERTFRLDDESVCVWIAEDQPRTLSVSVDVEAPDFEAALLAGLGAIEEAAQMGTLAGSPERVVAYTEEGYAEWTP